MTDILYLVKCHKQFLTVDLIGDITYSIVSVHERTKLQNAVIIKVILDIYIEILNSLHSMRLILPESDALSDYILNPPLTNMPLEQADTCLNIILLLLLENKTCNEININSEEAKYFDERKNIAKVPATNYDSESNEILQEFQIMPQEYKFVRTLNDNTMKALAIELKNSKALQITLKRVVKLPLYYPEAAMKSYAIMSLLTNFDMTLNNLLKESEKHPGDVKSPMMLCVERIVQNQGVEYKCAEFCLEYLTEISQPWQPDCLRFKAANLLTYIAVHYPKSMEMKRVNFVGSYIRLMLNLLMDDDFDIRNFTTKMVLHSLTEDIDLELSDNLSNDSSVGHLNIPIGTESVVSTVAQRLFLQYTANLLINYKMDDIYILEIFKLITSECFNKDNENQYSTDIEIFERNEANVFAEPLKVIFDIVAVFRSTFCLRPKVLHFVELFLQDLNNQESAV